MWRGWNRMNVYLGSEIRDYVKQQIATLKAHWENSQKLEKQADHLYEKSMKLLKEFRGKEAISVKEEIRSKKKQYFTLRQKAEKLEVRTEKMRRKILCDVAKIRKHCPHFKGDAKQSRKYSGYLNFHCPDCGFQILIENKERKLVL